MPRPADREVETDVEAPVVWLDGRLVPLARARVSPTDPGYAVGTGVFETLGIVADRDGAPQVFALTRHLRRLRRSAERLGLAVPVDDDGLRAAVRAVLDANAAVTGSLRITATGPLGTPAPDARTTVVVSTASPRPRRAAADLLVVPWRRNEHSPITGAKSTSYAENAVARQHALACGADEALFANTAGNLCEGTSSNVFVGIDGELVTPPLSSGCLAGIIRELLVEAIDVREADLPIGRLADADEVFVTSSLRGVHAVASIDGVPLAVCPGARTRRAADALRAIAERTLDP